MRLHWLVTLGLVCGFALPGAAQVDGAPDIPYLIAEARGVTEDLDEAVWPGLAGSGRRALRCGGC